MNQEIEREMNLVKNKPILNNKAYDIVKWFVSILLPAFVAAYVALSEVWSLPDTHKVVVTVTVIEVFLGAIFQLSSKQHANEVVNTPVITPDPDKMGHITFGNDGYANLNYPEDIRDYANENGVVLYQILDRTE